LASGLWRAQSLLDVTLVEVEVDGGVDVLADADSERSTPSRSAVA
jgi:hypothetical protein